MSAAELRHCGELCVSDAFPDVLKICIMISCSLTSCFPHPGHEFAELLIRVRTVTSARIRTEQFVETVLQFVKIIKSFLLMMGRKSTPDPNGARLRAAETI